MGIEGFYKWIKEEYTDCIYSYKSESIPKYYDHVYIDLNYLLHMCNYNSNNMVHTINKLKMIILDIAIKTQPKKSLNLFCDGVAPMAKLIEQRKRRENNITEDNLNNSTLNFTPGTIFLHNLKSNLNNIIKIIENQLCINIYADIEGDGEGELKIKNKLLDNYLKSNQDTHILATTDADVVLMSLANISYQNTYILLKDNILSIKQLLELHTNKYGKSEFPHIDFSFLNLFLGNDYIPKLKYISNDKLWGAYKKNLCDYKYLINDKYELNNEFLNDILTDIIANIKLCYYKKITLKDLDFRKIKNYLDGISWTFIMYRHGRCLDYRYIYNNDSSIDPLSLQIYLFENKYKLTIIKNPNIINNNLCALILLPNKAQTLIDEKYRDFTIKIQDNNLTESDIDQIVKSFNKYKLNS